MLNFRSHTGVYEVITHNVYNWYSKNSYQRGLIWGCRMKYISVFSKVWDYEKVTIKFLMGEGHFTVIWEKSKEKAGCGSSCLRGFTWGYTTAPSSGGAAWEVPTPSTLPLQPVRLIFQLETTAVWARRGAEHEPGNSTSGGIIPPGMRRVQARAGWDGGCSSSSSWGWTQTVLLPSLQHNRTQ